MRNFAAKRRLLVLLVILVATAGAVIYGLNSVSKPHKRIFFNHGEDLNAADDIGISPFESKVRWENRLKAEAQNGVVKSQFDLGEGYLKGSFPEGKNYPEAIKWLKEVAHNDAYQTNYHLMLRASAMEFLAGMYMEGTGVPKDYSEAMRLYHGAVELGSQRAGCAIGELYYFGQGVEKNEKEAAKWWKISQSDLEILETKENLNDAVSLQRLADAYRNSPCSYPQSVLAPERSRKAVELLSKGSE